MILRCMHSWQAVAAVLMLIAAMPASGQTCASPIPIVGTAFSGNTCNNSTHLPALANGAILTGGGGEDVYHISGADLSQVSVALQASAGVDLALFVCPNQCSTYATCIAAVDNGAGAIESVPLPDGPGDYYVIVASVAAVTPNCGSYNLSVSGPLTIK
jgi:hypothetical protein